jgi:hypothetical protein
MGLVRGIAVAAMACAVIPGCSTSATITRRDGTSVEGWIRGGTADSVIVDPRIGQAQEIPRSAIDDIDHPGNMHIVVGGLVLAYGVVGIVAAAPECGRNGSSSSDCGAAFVPALAGAGILAWGLVNWVGSKNSANDMSLARLPRKAPPALAPSRTEGAAPPPATLPELVAPPPAELPKLAPRAPAAAPSSAPPASSAPPEPPPATSGPEAPKEPSPDVTW